MDAKHEIPSYWSVYRRARKRTACDVEQCNSAGLLPDTNTSADENVTDEQVVEGSGDNVSDETCAEFRDDDTCESYLGVCCSPELPLSYDMNYVAADDDEDDDGEDDDAVTCCMRVCSENRLCLG